MITVHHINCGTIQAAPDASAACHCLLLEGRDRLALVDTGIGLLDVRDPDRRIGHQLIEAVGFRFDESDTAVRRIERLGFRPGDVTDVVLTHADPDHTGGLADFPQARIHISEEEYAALASGNPRYLPGHFDHGPRWTTYYRSEHPRFGLETRPQDRGLGWFGLEARPLDLGPGSDVLLVPLFGHTLGHCGVAVARGDRWVLHVGDAYYLRVELEGDDHPVAQLATLRAEDDARRRASLEELRRLARDHPVEIEMFGYHDPSEFPDGIGDPERFARR